MTAKQNARALLCALLFVGELSLAGSLSSQGMRGTIRKESFGKTASGARIDLYTLSNKKGMQVAITNFGATVVALKVPDRAGKAADVVLGFDTLEGYENGTAYFGATVGRYGNRIAGGQFSIDGKTYTLPRNNGNNTLHGGIVGFNKKVWKAIAGKDSESLEMSYLSVDGEEGFPGNLSVKVAFTLAADRNELKIDYTASTDKDTVLNLTNHSYFNLAGEGNGDILDHVLMLHAKRFTPVDKTLIPTGELRDVAGTPLDFTTATAIGKRISENYEQLVFGKGYDHNWVLARAESEKGLTLAAEAYDPKSGRKLEVLTTEPGVQFYSGNFLDGSAKGKGNKAYGQRAAFCLETQHFPDSPNHPNFPGTLLKPNSVFHSQTVFRFSAK